MSEIKVNKVSPATGTAITLGDSGDTFTVPSGATIVNSGTATGFGGGKVLQVLSSTKTDTFSTSATAFTDTGLSVSITPASGTKVLVLVNCNYAMQEGLEASGRLVRDSTAIAIGDAASSRPVGTFNMNRHHAYSDGSKWNSEAGMTYLDTHGADGSTAVTYKLQYSAIASSTIYMNRTQGDADDLSGTRAVSTITVMEIGA